MADGAERQLVVFDLANEVYGINIGTVREIIRMQTVTFVPDAPEFVQGVINLRGRVIPVVDLRKRFGLPVTEPTPESRVLVVDIAGSGLSYKAGDSLGVQPSNRPEDVAALLRLLGARGLGHRKGDSASRGVEHLGLEAV